MSADTRAVARSRRHLPSGEGAMAPSLAGGAGSWRRFRSDDREILRGAARNGEAEATARDGTLGSTCVWRAWD